MKFLQRCLSVLLCVALLSIAFSISVNATDSKEYKVTISTKITNKNNTYSKENLVVYPNNGQTEQVTHFLNTGIPAGQTEATILQGYVIEYLDNSKMIEKGRKTTLSINNVYLGALLTGNTSYYDRTVDQIRALVYYSDGTFVYIDDVTVEKPTSLLTNFILDFTPERDVFKVEFIVYNKVYTPNMTAINKDTTIDVYTGEFNSTEWALFVKQESEEVGLLQGIIDWLKGIKNNITDFMTMVGNMISNVIAKIGDVVNLITELPQKLWQLIENGLKHLFVPNAQTIALLYEEFDTILSTKLGAVYEVSYFFFEGWERLVEQRNTDEITLPSVTIDLPENNTFTFGGYVIDVVPNGFEFIVGMCKLAISIMCTLAFINGLRKRFDEVMGVEK